MLVLDNTNRWSKNSDLWRHRKCEFLSGEFSVTLKKREAKGKDKNRYQELKAEVQRKLRMDKQQQLEGMCMELEAANSKRNSRQLFQIVKSMTRKFHPRLQGIQSATGENLTEAAQIADRWKRYCEDLTVMRKGKELNTRVLGARASTTSFRGCSCHPPDSKSQSHRS